MAARRVRFTVDIESGATTHTYKVGQVVRVGTAWTADEIPLDSATELLAGGYVVDAKEAELDAKIEAEIEAAMMETAETAMLPAAKAKSRGTADPAKRK